MSDADVLYARGAALMKVERYAEALAAFDQALAVAPSRFEVLIGRAGALMQLERPQEAFEAFDLATSLKPEAPEGWYYRANALKELKRHEAALESLNRAVALKPDFLRPYFVRAQIYRDLNRESEALSDAERYEASVFRLIHGYEANLRAPRSFSEKVVHRKLFIRDPNFTMLADKWAVRDYVAQRVGNEILNEVLCVTTDPDEIDFAALPEAFVLKATHGSKLNLLVRNKAELNIAEAKVKCRGFLAHRYGESTNERHYLAIPPRLLAEPFLLDRDGRLAIDYKLFVFHGRCHCIWVHFDRFEEHTARFYDREWTPLDVTLHYPLGPVIERPKSLERMIKISEDLAAGFDFLRIDLYSPDGERVVFGEITVTSGAGYERFGPNAEFDFALGALW